MNILSEPDLDVYEKRDKVTEVLKMYNHEEGDWEQFAFFNENNYTRNLILENDKFQFILLCWNKGQASAIHNHPCDGCWVKGIRGTVKETQYS